MVFGGETLWKSMEKSMDLVLKKTTKCLVWNGFAWTFRPLFPVLLPVACGIFEVFFVNTDLG